MKTIKYLLFAFAAAFVFAGCSDDPTYAPGEGEDPNSYGVYFPSQESTGNSEFDPADEVKLTFKAMRKNFNDAITVPVEIISPAREMFTISDIEFEVGQVETEFTVTVEGAEIGKTYPCTIQVTDPRYANTYGSNLTGITFSVTRVQWNLVKGPNGETKGKWRDEFLTSIMSGNIKDNGVLNAEKDIEIYERADMPGYYRIKDIYDQAYITRIVGTFYTNFELLPNTYTIIDARDPQKVWLPAQSVGYNLNNFFSDSDGDLMYVSFVTENFPSNASATRYGTKDNGVITFPNKAIFFTAGSIDWQAGYTYLSSTSMTRIMLPGAREYDYSVKFTSAPPADGKVEITAKLGSDVAKVKYAYFEGALSDGVAASKAIDIDAGTVPSEQITASGTITAELEKTGIYTLVGSTYNEAGAQQSYGAVTFGYVKAGEEKPVVLSLRTELTWEFEALGHTPENSIKGIVFGEGVVSGYYGLIATSKIAKMSEAELTALVRNGNPITAANIDKINAGGWAPFFTKLDKGTSYTLLILADNGYNSKLFIAEQSTQGDPSPIDVIYTFEDALAGVPKDDLFKTTWNYYVVDIAENMTSREYMGEVTFSEDTEDGVDGDDRPVDYINVKGLSGLLSVKGYTGDDVMTAYWSKVGNTTGGLIYPKAKCDLGKYGNYFVTNFFLWEEKPTGLHTIDYALCGVYVAEGIIAFVPNDQYVPLGYTFTGMYFGAFNDAGYTSQAGYLSKFKHLLLVHPDADPNGTTAASVAKTVGELKAPTNYVELRGPALMQVVWNEKAIHPSARTATLEGEVTYPTVTPVKSSFSNVIVRPAVGEVICRISAQKQVE